MTPQRKRLVDLKPGEEAIVAGFDAGLGASARLESMGIVPGVRMRKVNECFLHGPVCVQVGNATTALGYGMASKVFVETGRTS